MAILSKITIGEAWHLYVDTDPTIDNVLAPIGSVAWIDDGTKAWRNTTGLANGWQSDASLLNLGTMAYQNADAIDVTGGTANLSGLLMKGDGTEGGQVFLGYKNTTSFAGGEDNKWSFDVFNAPSANSFRFFNKAAGANANFHWIIDEASQKQGWGAVPVLTHPARFQFFGDTYAHTNYVIVGVFQPNNVPLGTDVRYVMDANGAGNNMLFYRTINGGSTVYSWSVNYVNGVFSLPENNNQTKVDLANRSDAGATTQWVSDRLRSSRVVAASTTLLATDNIIIVENGAINITLTIPTTLIYAHIIRGVGSTGTITVQGASSTIMDLNRTMGATTSIAVAGALGDSVEFMQHPTNTALIYRK